MHLHLGSLLYGFYSGLPTVMTLNMSPTYQLLYLDNAAIEIVRNRNIKDFFMCFIFHGFTNNMTDIEFCLENELFVLYKLINIILYEHLLQNIP